jgi:hypothetical protein
VFPAPMDWEVTISAVSPPEAHAPKIVLPSVDDDDPMDWDAVFPMPMDWEVTISAFSPPEAHAPTIVIPPDPLLDSLLTGFDALSLADDDPMDCDCSDDSMDCSD